MARQHSTARNSAQEPTASGRTSRMAIWSLVLSIISLGGIGSIAGIAMGAKARRRVAETGELGRGLALAAIIVGVFTLFLSIAYWAYLGTHFNVSPGHGSFQG